jgi:hypothetical protein
LIKPKTTRKRIKTKRKIRLSEVDLMSRLYDIEGDIGKKKKEEDNQKDFYKPID